MTTKLKLRTVYWLILTFLVHVCADLYRVLAHACVWEVSRVTLKFKVEDYLLLIMVSVYMCLLIYTYY